MDLMVYREINFKNSYFNVYLDSVESEESERKKFKRYLNKENGLDVFIDRIKLRERFISGIELGNFYLDFTKRFSILFEFYHEELPVRISSSLSFTMDLNEPEYIDYIIFNDIPENERKKIGLPKVIHLFGKKEDSEEELKVIILKANIHDKGPEFEIYNELLKGVKVLINNFRNKK